MRRLALFVTATFLIFFSHEATAQSSQEEHLSHHPELAAQATAQAQSGVSAPSTNAGPQASPGMGGMMSMMDDMMKKMGAPAPKDIYPSLIELPELTPEKKEELRSRAKDRMVSGLTLLNKGLEDLSTLGLSTDYKQMEEASQKVREGLSQYESGIAVQRALDQGKSPQTVALQWFKSEMNLLEPEDHNGHQGLWGLSFFHLSVMVILILFSLTMVFMYFFKMRRAAALLSQLTSPGIPKPPSGNSNPPVSGSPPSAPPSQTPPSSGPPTQNLAPQTSTRPKSWTGSLRVSFIKNETHNIKTFSVIDPSGALPFDFIPGQYLNIIAKIDGKQVKRSYTIASPPTRKKSYDLTIKREEHGIMSSYLHDQIRIGDDLSISGPAGFFSFTGAEASNLVLIGAGVGVTPLMSVLRYLADIKWNGQVTVLFSFKTQDDILFQAEIEEIKKVLPTFQSFVTLTRAEGKNWNGLRGRFVGETILKCAPNVKEARIHVCGPSMMMDAIKGELLSLGVPKDFIKIEYFAPPDAAVPVTESIVSTATTVFFALSNKKAFIPSHLSVLEAAESIGVPIDFSCRAGTCGSCKIKLLSGEVTMAIDDSLDPADKANGYVLACQAKPKGDLVIEA